MTTKLKNRKAVVTGGKPVGVDVKQRVAQANRWRDNYNPLRSMTIARLVSYLEAGQRGEFADLMWLYNFIEMTDPDLLALVERRTSAITQLDWNIKIIPSEDKGAQSLADDQAAALREAYDTIDNMTESFESLAMASFRGYAHLQKYFENGKIVRLESIDQWNFARDGMFGDWKFNDRAGAVSFTSLPPESLLKPEEWIIRTVRRPIDRVGAIKYLRANLCEKDWDSFVEVYGVPGCIVIGPPNVPESKESEYQDAGGDVAEGNSGYLPNGSDVKFPGDGVRGNSPFAERLDYLQRQLILAGTGGLLTMLNEPTGIGGGQAESHADTFAAIARAEAKKISEVFQNQIDRYILADKFEGKPVLAYFDLAASEEPSVNEVLDHVVKLSSAGYQVDLEELAEKTGYKITLKPQTPAFPPAFQNREPVAKPDRLKNVEPAPAPDTLLQTSVKTFAEALSDDLSEVRARLEYILTIEDPFFRDNALKNLQVELPAMLERINADPASAQAMEAALSSAALNGWVEAAQNKTEEAT